MGLVPAICTQCGANIEVDDTKEAGICKHCGTAFITEKAINIYNTSNIYNIQHADIIIPTINLENLRRLGDEEYINKNYKMANSYYRRILEIKNEDYECIFRRFLCLVREKYDPYHNSYRDKMLENISNYFSYIDLNEILSVEEKNESIGFACEECKDIIMNNFRQGINECFIDGKLKTQSSIYSIQSICTNTDVFLKKILCVLEPWLDKYKSVGLSWNNYCYSMIYILETLSGRYDCVNGMMYGRSESGAENVYEKAEQVELLWKKIKPDYNLPTNLKSPSKGGEGIKTVGNGCYIATCVYGSYDCPQVWTLRRYRDYTLDETWYGRLFIKCYYAISPTLVKWFGKTKWFRRFWRSKLDKMVANLNNKGIENTHYKDKY